MYIEAVSLRLDTERGPFGFEHRFGRNLTIIRGRNSSGKSTVVNSLLYGLGMEELIGAKGEAALPYAVKDWLDYDGNKIGIDASEVLVELSGSGDRAITVRRAIKHASRSVKLVEIANGRVLTGRLEFKPDLSTYLFDPGAAQVAAGFHRFLEAFLGLSLPQVAATSGAHTKLYLQAIFSALAVEQKRGWTDYIATIPFFGIRDARTRVVEYLLGLDVFEVAARRSELDAEAVAINYEWEAVAKQVRTVSETNGLIVRDVPPVARAKFGAASPAIRKRLESGEIDVRAYVESLRNEYAQIEARLQTNSVPVAGQSQAVFDHLVVDLQRLGNLYETATASLALKSASLSDLEELYAAAREDLNRNRTTAKLMSLGAKHDLALASDRCPTCHQPVADTLVAPEIAGPQMDLAANIDFLEKQCSMFDRQVAGLRGAVHDGGELKAELGRRVTAATERLDAARRDLASGSQQSRVELRRQLQIEGEVKQLEVAEVTIANLLVELQKLAARLATNQDARKRLPSLGYSDHDNNIINLFEKNFRANASAFEYESASVTDIEINRNALLPSLQASARVRTDIKADSSASDFVRLIWSYLLALYQTSANLAVKGNHPGLLLFDEPGQHSMAATSQHALMQLLAGERGLQSIVAASFDESEVVFREATNGVAFVLIQIGEKAIQPLAPV